jgi:outer membrane protein assembly factor BamB
VAYGCLAISLSLLFSVPTAADEPAGAFAEVCFAPFDEAATPTDVATWQRWIEQVAGQPGSLQMIGPRSGRGCRLTGTHRLVPAWTDGLLLRMLLQPSDHFCLHLFHGLDGVSLRFDAGSRSWGAFTTRRQLGACKPQQVTLAATDGGRTRRSQFAEPVPIALHYQQGELIVTRGDLILLGVPLSDMPQEMYLDGQADLHDIDRWVCTDLPAMPTDEVGQFRKPAELSWNQRLGPGATFQELDSGAVELGVENSDQSGWATTQVVAADPCQLTLRLDRVSPGTGVFLSTDRDAQPAAILLFVSERRDGRIGILFADRLGQRGAGWGQFPGDVSPAVSDPVWLRIIYGAGTLRWWVSNDGRHWAEPERRLNSLAPRSMHLGLCHVRNAASAKIELGAVALKPFTTLATSCPQRLRQRAERAIDSWQLDQGIAEWQQSVRDSCPPDADLQEWSNACNVAAIAAGTDAELGNYLLSRLVDRSSRERWPFDRRLALLDEVCLLADSRLFQQHGPALPQRYFDLAYEAWRQEGIAPLNPIRTALMTAPLDHHAQPVWSGDGIIRDEVLDAIYQADWRRLRQTCAVLNYFRLHHDNLLVVWADQLSAAILRADPIITGRRIPNVSWPSLLSEDLNRDVYNQNIELQMLIKSAAWEDAAKQIASAMTLDLRGVAPAAADPDLLVSSAVAVRAALLEYRGLLSALESDQSELLNLQVKRAIAGRSTSRVEQLARRFPGTSAARTAEKWLGDQLLARGQAKDALAHYERASSFQNLAADPSLPARLNLAAAYAGQPPPVSFDTPAEIGEVTIQPTEVAALSSELAKRRRETSQQAGPGSWPSLAFGRLRTGQRVALPLAVGNEPAKEVLPGIDRQRIDWPGCQLAAVRAGDKLLVHNRFELLALQWDTGQSLWTNHPMGEEMLRSRDWPLIPMRPLVHERRVVARHLCAKTPQLACWDLDAGQLLWISPLEDQLPISDPFIVEGKLGVLTMDQQRAIDAPLRLQWIDIVTGQPAGHHTLVRLRDGWWRRSCCQVLSSGQHLYVVLGGIAFACDDTATISWVRTSRTTPPEADPTWIAQLHQVPLLADGKLVLSQVGVRAVEAVDPTTGSLLWRSVEPQLRQAIGIADDVLIIQTQSGLAALDLEDGTRVWQHDQPALLLAAYCNPSGVLYSHATTAAERSRQQGVELVILDARSGQIAGRHIIEELSGSQPRVAPLVVGDDRAWAFFSAGALGGQREMLELLAEEKVP